MGDVKEDIIEELVQQKLEGKSYSEIRSELMGKGLSMEEVSKVIKQVDEKVLLIETGQKYLDKARQWYRIGIILAIIGLLITIAFKAGIILNTLPPLAVYFPFLAGIGVMFYGRMLQRKKHDPYEKGPGRIRSKRPYK